MIGNLRCFYLEITNTPGTPLATRCTIYDKRIPDMPIPMIDYFGNTVKIGNCAFSKFNMHPDEKQAILERGIGKGCSLRVEEING